MLLSCEEDVLALFVDCRYRLFDEGRDRIEGSDRLEIAFVVLSRANAAKLKSPVRVVFEELVEGVD